MWNRPIAIEKVPISMGALFNENTKAVSDILDTTFASDDLFMNSGDLFHQADPVVPFEIIQLQLRFSQNHMDAVEFLVRAEAPPAFCCGRFRAWLKIRQGDFRVDDVFYTVDVQQIMWEIDVEAERGFVRRDGADFIRGVCVSLLNRIAPRNRGLAQDQYPAVLTRFNPAIWQAVKDVCHFVHFLFNHFVHFATHPFKSSIVYDCCTTYTIRQRRLFSISLSVILSRALLVLYVKFISKLSLKVPAFRNFKISYRVCS